MTPPGFLPDHLRSVAPHGWYDLGMAHGVPGVIAFLVRASAAGFTDGRLPALLGGAVAWLLGRELDDADGCFPA